MAAIIAFLVTYGAMEITGFLFPKPNSRYYIEQIISDLRTWVRVHTQFGNTVEAQRAEARLQVIESAIRAGDVQIVD